MSDEADFALMNQEGEAFDMTREPRGPYRLTLAEFESAPVSEQRKAMRNAIYQFEELLCDSEGLRSVGLDQITKEDPRAQPENILIPGIYVRKLVMKAGTVVVGLRHAQEHVCIISQGRATVSTEGGTQEIHAPMHFVSPAGTKRCVHVHEDMVWTTIHRTDKTDIREIEAEITLAEPARAVARLKGSS